MGLLRRIREWRSRRLQVVKECATCNAQLTQRQAHILVEVFDDDHVLLGGPAWGATGVSISYCAQHCPGSCGRCMRR